MDPRDKDIIEGEIVDVEVIEPEEVEELERETAGSNPNQRVYVEFQQNFGSSYNDLNTKEDIMTALMGFKANYFWTKFDSMESRGSIFSLNIAAIFFPFLWMIYRKMYAIGIGYFVFDQLILEPRLEGLGFILSKGIYILIACISNFLYKKHVESLASKALMLSTNERRVFVAKKGGTNPLAVIFILFVTIVMSIASFIGYIFTAGI